MKTVMCRVCLKFFKRKRVGRTLEWCGVCKQLCCTAHITNIVISFESLVYSLQSEKHIRTCKLCMAEKALTTV